MRRGPADNGDAAPTRREVDPEIFVMVLEHLDAGKHIVDVAKLMKLLPAQLDPIYRWWAEKRGGYLVTSEMAEEIHGHLFLFAKNINEGRGLKNSPTVLIQMLDRLANRMQLLESEAHEKGKCTACRTTMATFCPTCAKKRFADEE